MRPAPLSERVERSLVVVGLLSVSALAWVYLAGMRGPAHAGHHAGAAVSLPAAEPWSGAEWAMSFAMWTVMMAGMMLPTTLPVALTFAELNRDRDCGPLVPVGAFVGGYLAVWTGYSVFATVGQWGLHAARLLSPATLATGPAVGGLFLILAGLFQWSPWKEACMTRCRSPLGFLLAVWRPGRTGAFTMGARYGAFCVGCCWALMLLSFGVGIMNLAWMAALTAFMLAEKVAPAGRWLSRAGGLGLAGWGAALLWRALA